MASDSASGADFMKSRLGIVVEHAASMKPHAMTAMTRLIIASHHAVSHPLLGIVLALRCP
jgi:phosphate starvation-inducible membrane PsiE